MKEAEEVGSQADSAEGHPDPDDDDRLAERLMKGEAVVEAELKSVFGCDLFRERMVWVERAAWMIRKTWWW